MCPSERRIRSALVPIAYKGEMEKYFSIFPLVDVDVAGGGGGEGEVKGRRKASTLFFIYYARYTRAGERLRALALTCILCIRTDAAG